MSQRIQDAEHRLKEIEEDFLDNVRDAFGNAVLDDFFVPCEKEIKSLEEAVHIAGQEERAIQDMLQKVRAML